MKTKNCYLVMGYKRQYYIRYKKEDGKWTMLSTKETDIELARKKLEIFLEKQIVKLKPEEIDNRFENTNYNLSELKEKYIQVFGIKKRKGLDTLFQEVISVVGNKRIDELTVIDAEKYKQFKSEGIFRGRKTVYACNLNLRILKAIFNKCIRAELITKNVWKSVKQIKIPEKKKLAFDENEIEILLKTIDDQNLKNIVIFGLYTGCRISEIINMKWQNVNLKDNLIEIINDDGFTTKSKKNRYIPISPKLTDILTQNRLTEYVFCKSNGYKYRMNYISKRFKRYIRLAGLSEKYHFHCTRHTFISSLIEKGVSINYVKELAGHANIQTTMHYVHIKSEELRKAVNLL